MNYYKRIMTSVNTLFKIILNNSLQKYQSLIPIKKYIQKNYRIRQNLVKSTQRTFKIIIINQMSR